MSVVNMEAKVCFLLPLSHADKCIQLPDGVVVAIGRSKVSGITDMSCSRRQVLAKADYSKELVLVKAVGGNPSYLFNKPMVNKKEYHLRHGSIIEIVHGKLSFKVVFSTRSVAKPKTLMTYFWKMCGCGELLMCISSGFNENKQNVASFDLDGTLIKTKSGRVFGTDFNDWMFWDNSVKNVLHALNSSNYKIVIFTNQAMLGTVGGNKKIDGFKNKIENIVNRLCVPVQVLIAVSNGLYRKPSPGMWYFMKCRSGAADLHRSFYVGDAAGRPENWKPGKKADFSASDRMFAMNIGLQFYTPEEYFLKEPSADYSPFILNPRQKTTNELPNLRIPSMSQEVILMAGIPGSGKSHFVTNYIKPHGYCIISRDKSGSWQKCVSQLEKAIENRKNAVIDNVNADRASRDRFREICVKHNIRMRCFLMDVPLERCLHNNKFREIIDGEHELIGSSLIRSYNANFEPPTLEEGFSSILKIPFVELYSNWEQEHFYKCYLVDK